MWAFYILMPSIAITGDVHHYLGNHPKEKNEHFFTEEYVEIISQEEIKATLFVTGKSIEQHQKHWHSLSKDYPVEFGGHTYYAFQPSSIFYAYKDLLGRFGHTYGPVLYQLMDISKTVKAFEKADIPINSWRTHGYRGDKVTGKLLPDFGIKYVSELKMVPSEELINLPITCYPDDHVFLSSLIQKKYDPEREMKKVKESIFEAIEQRKDVILQLHPSSMRVYDDFSSLKQIIKKLKDAGYEFETISSLGEKINKDLPVSKGALSYYD